MANTLDYLSYAYKLKQNSLHTKFTYQIDKYHFVHKISFDFPSKIVNTQKALLDNLVFHLGLCEMPSYYKTLVPSKINISCGYLGRSQIKFWKNLFLKGMGEFYYQNKINFTKPNFLNFTSHNRLKHQTPSFPLNDTFLLPLGGGKDSCVSLDLLMHYKKPFTPLKVITTTPLPAIDQVLEAANLKRYITVKRTLDPKILTPQNYNFLQGHIPFSSTLFFIASSSALLLGHRYLAFSNEASSNQGNVTYLGKEINHQYSKTLEFEKAFHHYAKKHLHSKLYVFSLLRPFNELQISQAFAKLPHFFNAFVSCNKGQRSGTWCGSCPKCVSTYLMLKPFLKNLNFISANNLLTLRQSKPILNELLGKTVHKPFECVATYEETKLALNLVNQENATTDELISTLTTHHSLHLIPKSLLTLTNTLLKPSTSSLIPVSRILILGFGREGQSTLNFLTKNYKNLNLTIADQNTETEKTLRNLFPKLKNISILTGAKYPTILNSFQLVFKSPGISHHAPIFKSLSPHTILTSQTKLFFEVCRGTIIGVTGTKGKSTTTSLIHHVLKQNKLPAILLGNIGLPALDYLDKNNLETIYCFELSSHQLSDLYRSPHISVIQAISPEHLDYYKDFNEYVNSKLNIARYQTPLDHLIYNSTQSWPRKAAKLTLAHLHPFSKNKPPFLNQKKIPLKGTFNYLNIWPSIIVAYLYKLNQNQIRNAIYSFTPLSHRLQTVATRNGIQFIDDSLSTTPVATNAALQTFKNKIGTLILGGAEREQEFTQLIPYLKKFTPTNIILFDPTGPRIRTTLEPKLPNINYYKADSMQQAIELTYKHTPNNKICLLSTAAPSFGMFKDYEDKAAQFIYWIQKLS